MSDDRKTKESANTKCSIVSLMSQVNCVIGRRKNIWASTYLASGQVAFLDWREICNNKTRTRKERLFSYLQQ